MTATIAEVQPFDLHVPDEVLDDLRSRLERSRLLPDSPRKPASGMTAGYLRELVGTWIEWDWRAREAWLNGHPQFIAQIDDSAVHFAHLRSARADAPALLVMHGWPHTFALQLDFADRLPDFHVVVASLPGFGFSTPLASHGWDIARTARAFDELMQALGYERYTVFGEDVGAGVSEQLCLDAGDRVLGSIAATDPGSIATEYTPPTNHLTDDERERHEQLKAAGSEGYGYLALQTTRPLSIAYGLTDSPIAQATWIIEKFQEWTDPAAGLPEDAVDLDALLTLVTVSWFGRAGDGAANMLYEAAHAEAAWGREHNRPQGITAFGQEPLMERILNPDGHLAFWSEHRRGGHFPAMEAPDELVGDIRAYFARLLTA